MSRIFEIHDAAFRINHIPVLGKDAKKWFVPEGEILLAVMPDDTISGFVCVIENPR